MKKFFFLLFSRNSVAFSGLIFFVITANLFGSEGRGLIGFGFALVYSVSMVFCLNTGRAFFSSTILNNKLKKEYLYSILSINLISILFQIFLILTLWFCFEEISKIINFKILLILLLMIPYYNSLINNQYYYAVIDKTLLYDYLIIFFRFLLIIFLFSFYKFGFNGIENFILIYSLLLFTQSFVDYLIIYFYSNKIISKNFIAFYKQLIKTNWFHLDYLSFYLFPLIFLLICGFYLDLNETGKVNFILQLLSFVYIIPIASSLRVKTFLSNNNTAEIIPNILKYFIVTIFLCFTVVLILFYILSSTYFSTFFDSFKNLNNLFILYSSSLIGYILYSFAYPIVIKFKFIKIFSIINFVNLILFLLILWFYKFNLNIFSFGIIFILFYSSVFIISCFFIIKIIREKYFLND